MAWNCGVAHPNQLLATLDSQEYSEVLAYASTTPTPQRRADLRAGMMALVAAKSQGVKGVSLEDFLPRWGETTEEGEQTPTEIDRQMAKVAGMMEARDNVG